MKKNVGKTDKTIRYILGLLGIAAGVYFLSWWGLVGLGILLPAIMGSDPLYDILKVDTNK